MNNALINIQSICAVTESVFRRFRRNESIQLHIPDINLEICCLLNPNLTAEVFTGYTLLYLKSEKDKHLSVCYRER